MSGSGGVQQAIRIVEEALLLVLDDEHGDLSPTYSSDLLDIVVAGAVLMELALEGRIDTDLERLVLVDSTPLEDDLLDSTLADIAAGPGDRHADFWLARTAERSGEIRDRALSRLVERGILEAEAGGMFLSRIVSRSRRYPTRDGRPVEEVRLRIMRTLFSDEIPDPRDVVLICLSDASGVLRRLLTPVERTRLRERIELIGKLDLIGRSLLPVIRESRRSAEVPAVARPVAEIPEVKGLPLLGSALSMSGDVSVFFAKQYSALGPCFRVRALNRRLTVLAGPEAVLFLQREGRTHLRETHGFRRFTWALGAAQSITNLEGAAHTRMRKAMAPGLSPKRIHERMSDLLRLTRLELDGWVREGPVRALPALQRLISRQNGALFADIYSEDFHEDIDHLMTVALSVHLAKTSPKWRLKFPRTSRARKRQRALIEEILATRQEAKAGKRAPTLVDYLLEQHREDPQFLPEEDFPITLLVGLFAGIHTSAFICAFVLYEALKRPHLLEKMRAEADAFFGNETNAAPTLADFDVTQRFVMETLRVYSLTPAAERSVTNAFSFEGYRIPAGTDIIVAFAAAHHLPEYFPDPRRFDIERYTPERAEHRAPGVYIPFGAGAHSCLGRGVAQLQLVLTLATIFREVDLAMAPPNYKLKVTYGLTPRPGNSFRLAARRRAGGHGDSAVLASGGSA
ncbi:MAG: cytochrome P450 [Acidobacteria bacterium]|nr:cytochrome P450 [Acidobacteriota bacterium]